jgi:hypothetical protein
VTLATSVKNYYHVVTLDSQIALILNTNLAHFVADLATLLELDLYFTIVCLLCRFVFELLSSVFSCFPLLSVTFFTLDD